jgi:hypothetical protein
MMGELVMKCEYFVTRSGGYISSIVIEKDNVYLKEGNEKQVLDVDSKQCFNTLISLYSLKSSWINSECLRPIYKVCFEEQGECNIYNFDVNSLPENWLLFMAYINKLVGDAI